MRFTLFLGISTCFLMDPTTTIDLSNEAQAYLDNEAYASL